MPLSFLLPVGSGLDCHHEGGPERYQYSLWLAFVIARSTPYSPTSVSCTTKRSTEPLSRMICGAPAVAFGFVSGWDRNLFQRTPTIFRPTRSRERTLIGSRSGQSAAP